MVFCFISVRDLPVRLFDFIKYSRLLQNVRSILRRFFRRLERLAGTRTVKNRVPAYFSHFAQLFSVRPPRLYFLDYNRLTFVRTALVFVRVLNLRLLRFLGLCCLLGRLRNGRVL